MTEGPAPSDHPKEAERNSVSAWAREAGDFATILAIGVPPAAVCAWLVLRGEISPHAWLALGLAVGLSVTLAWWMRGARSRQLGTISSVLASYREGDFSIRARDASRHAPLHGVLSELNQLGDTLREHRLGEMEAWALLRKVMAEVDVVVLAFSDTGKVRVANDAAARVLGKASSMILGREADTLGLSELLTGAAPRVVKSFASLDGGPWELRRGAFRLSGEPHTLVVLSDVSFALREQERDAWKRLIRVMGHEINNSLAPIQSISENLLAGLRRPGRAPDWEDDLASGLEVVARRAEALGRFMTGYATLARLPPPKLGHVSVEEWVSRVAKLEQRLRVEIGSGPSVVVLGDADQLDQLLINLVRNAVDAARESGGGVRVGWTVDGGALHVTVDDDGPGVSDTANLFVPFFTTKAGGSGIGLVLARQIAEAHGGEVSLRTRSDKKGAEAHVRLPIRAGSSEKRL